MFKSATLNLSLKLYGMLPARKIVGALVCTSVTSGLTVEGKKEKIIDLYKSRQCKCKAIKGSSKYIFPIIPITILGQFKWLLPDQSRVHSQGRTIPAVTSYNPTESNAKRLSSGIPKDLQNRGACGRWQRSEQVRCSWICTEVANQGCETCLGCAFTAASFYKWIRSYKN